MGMEDPFLETELPELEADNAELKNTRHFNSISVFIFIDWCLTMRSGVVTIFTACSNINVPFILSPRCIYVCYIRLT